MNINRKEKFYMKKKITDINILLITVLFVFSLFLTQDSNKAMVEDLYGENYYTVINNNTIDNIYVISSTGDVYKEFANYLALCRETTDKTSMIYFPSGDYTLSNCKKISLASNLFIVGEYDTTIKNKQTDYCMLRANSDDYVSNVTIYGSIWDGNNIGKYVFLFQNTNNFKLIDTVVKNSASHGLYMNTCTNFFMDGCIICDNALDGIFTRRNSTNTIINSDILDNGGHGIQVSQSTLNLDYKKIQNNTITGNAWSGISQTGDTSSMYICGNTVSENGVKPKNSNGNLVGHGVGVSEQSKAIICNNTINENSQCGISVFDGGQANISNNIISKNDRHGIGARKNICIDLDGNTISQNKYNGILLSDQSAAAIKNSTITDSGKYGLSISDLSAVTLDHCTISKSGYTNVSLTVGDQNKKGSSLALLSGNVISGSKNEFGIGIIDGSSVKVSGTGNQITRNKSDGIRMTNGSSLNAVTKSGIYVAENGGYGIRTTSSKLSVSEGLKCTKNHYYGIYAANCDTFKLYKSNVYGNVGTGVYLYKTKANIKASKFKNNTINGIRHDGKSILTLNNSTISSNANCGIIIENEGVLNSTGNIISANAVSGLQLLDGGTANLSRTTIRNNYGDNVLLSITAAGKASSSLKLKSGNAIYKSKNGAGILCDGGSNVKVTGKNNKIYKNKTDGISLNNKSMLYTSSKSDIKVSSNKKNGIYLTNSSVNSKGGVTCAKNRKNGLYAYKAVDVTVKNCTFTANKQTGIYVLKTANVKAVTKNNITNNKIYGMKISGSKINSVKSNILSNHSANDEIYVIKCKGNYNIETANIFK